MIRAVASGITESSRINAFNVPTKNLSGSPEERIFFIIISEYYIPNRIS
jgi:hypothetical protein